METEIIKPAAKTKTIPLKTDLGDVFVLVLLPKLPAFRCENPLDIKICGRSILDSTLTAIGGLPHKQIPVAKSDDILTVVRANASDRKYTCVIYADTPLLTANTFEQAVAFVKSFGHKAAKMPRGWIFETNFIKNAETGVTPEEIPNLPPEDFIAAYSFSQLAIITAVMRTRINLGHLAEGVQIIDPNTAYIDAGVTIERGAVIEPNVYLCGKTSVGKGAQITSGAKITDSRIGAGAAIKNSQIVSSEVGEGTAVGPYANLREGNVIGKNCRVGSFVEFKKVTAGDESKFAHLTYVGDAIIGKDCNIGGGVAFANYNGKTKNQCILGDRVFVGCNSVLVAPLNLANDAYVAAGSVITKDVPAHALAIARTMQAVKENYWNVKKGSEETE